MNSGSAETGKGRRGARLFFVFSCGFEREAEVEIGRKEMALVGFFCSWFLASSRLLRPILKKLESRSGVCASKRTGDKGAFCFPMKPLLFG